ncbi:MAG: ATPase [Gammaproteobacteria bacterium]|nr:ATPase [Gammaproteobacteria bacterium]
MFMTRDEFLGWPRRAITLLGMSGVGKTTLAYKLPSSSWFHYSGDYRIGTKYLEEPFLDNVKEQAMKVPFLRDLLRSDSIYISSNITVHNLEPISTFLGKIGATARGGLPYAEFLRRQRLHRDAEIAAMKDVAAFIGKAHDIYGYDHFLNDAGGSICELDDTSMLEVLARHTLILYLKAGEDMEQELIRRAVDRPKPLYYREEFLEAKLADYLAETGCDSAAAIDPDSFVTWIFPHLVQHRRPRYAAIAERYGYTVNARDINTLRDEADFLDLVSTAIGQRSNSGTR